MPATAATHGPPRTGRVHVIGAGPVGLLLTALLQSVDEFDVRLYEKRREYTRTRMVKLASYLVADSVASYRADGIDGENVAAIFEPSELEEGLAFRQSIPPDLMSLLQGWSLGFVPLSGVEQSLSDLIDGRAAEMVSRTTTVVSEENILGMLERGDTVVDCTGTRSLLRDRLAPPDDDDPEEGGNTLRIRLEYALVITFLYGQPYDCNEYCKFYKNVDNLQYKFIPAVHRTHYDGAITHVTGIVNITPDDFEAMPPTFDGAWLRANFPLVTQSMDRFIDMVKLETNGEILGDLEIVRIPLDVYRARNATNRAWRRSGPGGHPFSGSPVFLLGDSAIGSPYFQSISLGFECAMFLAGLLRQRDLPEREMLDRYEHYMYKQWLRVYMRSKTIKHNKDIFETVSDTFATLEKLHIY
jgi:hypothetical protein